VAWVVLVPGLWGGLVSVVLGVISSDPLRRCLDFLRLVHVSLGYRGLAGRRASSPPSFRAVWVVVMSVV